MSNSYSFSKNISLLGAKIARGDLGGVLRIWQNIPIERHHEGVEAMLLCHFSAGTSRSLEALMTIHGTHPDIKISPSDNCFTYNPAANNGKAGTYKLKRDTKYFKNVLGSCSLVSSIAFQQINEINSSNYNATNSTNQEKNFDFHNQHNSIQGQTNDYNRSSNWKNNFDIIYGNVSNKLLNRLNSLHPDMESTMLSYCYGQLMGRKVLSLMDFELVLFSIITVAASSPQLYSHTRGALITGATVDLLYDIVDTLYSEEDISEANYSLVKRTIQKVLKENPNLIKNTNSKL